eukprot:tig00000241_g20894.t1
MLSGPLVVFLLEQLQGLGCAVDREKFINCQTCEQGIGAGFRPAQGGDAADIVLCGNRVENLIHAEQLVTHELIHAYDECRAKVRWDDCVHHACSEIRAASLSGECSFDSELGRGYLKFRKHHEECVKRRVLLSLAPNPACKEPLAAFEKAWSTCSKDYAPFTKIP